MGAPQAGFLSDDNLWFWLALFGPWKNKNPVFTELHTERAQPPPLPCSILPRAHGHWMFPQEKESVASQAIYKTILIYAVSLKRGWNHPGLSEPGLAAFLAVTPALESPARYSEANPCTPSPAPGPSLCHHQDSKAHQRLLSLCLLCFPSPGSFSSCWCKLGSSLLKEMKLEQKRTGPKK